MVETFFLGAIVLGCGGVGVRVVCRGWEVVAGYLWRNEVAGVAGGQHVQAPAGFSSDARRGSFKG